MNKLTVCVYPLATILPEVSMITGLDNYNLSGQATFDTETGELLNSFLARLPKPLCLVAHNGGLYDFPLLKAELVCIKEIFKRREGPLQLQNKIDFICFGKPTS